MISVYSDGSSSGRNDKPGGYGWVILIDGQPVAAGYGGEESTTNNRMEMLGAIEGLRAAKKLIAEQGLEHGVELVSDSEYTLGSASGRFNASKNLDLVEQIRALASELRPRFRWVRGHDGDTYNERCDSLAKRGKKEAQERLQRAMDDVGEH